MLAKRVFCVVITLAAIAARLPLGRPAVAAETAGALKPIRIVLVGDSTVSSYDTRPADKPDLTGWGQVFGDFFNDKVTVLNHAMSGRSTRSFIKEGLWKKALAAKGDYIFVQFGHNDSHLKDGKPAVDPTTDYQMYLRQYIDEARAAGAKPILVTPVARRTFENGKIVTGLQRYADAMLKIGKEKNVPVIDLHAAAMRLFDRLGDAGSADMSAAASDRTHFSRKGALAMARLVADALPQAVPELRPYLKSAAAETDAPPRFPIERVSAHLFDDPLWHGAADPTVIWAPEQQEWRIYYTQRRAALKNPNGVDWCHGSAIGIATSKDGREWKYAGICTGDEGLGEPIERKCSWWAPCVIRHDGQFHLFVAYVDGIYTKWTGKRTIKHFTSSDGKTWKYQMTLPLSSDNCIDPCIYRIGDKWLVWYKDEGHGSRTYAAESPDLKNWKVIGPAVTDVHHEAPLVWRWKGAYWMIVDAWAGLRIYRSADGLGNWQYNTTILASPGKRAKDGVQGGHPYVLEQGDRPVVFYHVHFAKGRETVLQAAELEMDATGKVICNRDKYAAAESTSANRYLFSIDRHAVVTRHNVVLDAADPTTALQVGNGEIAFGVDVTGLQTFYGNTMSHWGWHTFPLPKGKRIDDFRLTPYDTYGRPVGYATSGKGQEDLYRWLRENPHRFNLGRFSLRLIAADGKEAALNQIQQVRQELDLWQGLIESRFVFDNRPVRVETCADPVRDAVAVRIESPLVAQGRLSVAIAFPYGSPSSSGADWNRPDAHETQLTLSDHQADFARQLDSDRYAARLTWSGRAVLKEEKKHTYVLLPGRGDAALEWVCTFAKENITGRPPTFSATKAASRAHWSQFWSSGGAIDLSHSKDPRWKELERRIVLSQYLLAVQEAGSLPPQESGLFNNGWNGKFHLEMHWWHAAHYALWDRWPLIERSLGWYPRILPSARKSAQAQGYRGARWPKMVGPDGRDSPSGVGPLLIWQQPHPIFYALLDYRLHPTAETLKKWQDVVFATADFLASYAVFDKASGRYVLGPPLKTVPEHIDPTRARNPAFELSYWRFGLRTAQQWRERLGLARDREWDEVLHGLAPLPTADGLYLQQEGMTDTYTNWNWEHPSLIGVLGMLPGDGVEPAIMRPTVRRVMADWQWDRGWGWDFPMMAMAAARNGEPNMAIEALLHSSKKCQFNVTGLSTGGPFPHFPSNGGLLYAAAMMCAGWDGAAGDKGPGGRAPGFPHDGNWTVRWEGLKQAP